MNTQKVYDIFRQLNAIPRPSHHEERVADFLCRYAESLGLDYSRDKENCVVIRKTASPGCENAEPIVLLNHMDMVAVDDGSRSFNPLEDGIDAYTEDGWMKARGTSLGADNGIGLSMALAVLADDTIQHPALEVLTTTNEEDGMSGAANLSPDFIKGRKVINLDSEDYDTITIGAAGALIHQGEKALQGISLNTKEGRNIADGLVFYEIMLCGGLGGHSGVDINKGRCNAIVEMCRMLFRFKYNPYHDDGRRTETLYIHSINGGNAAASIPSACSFIVGVQKEDAEEFRLQVEDRLPKLQRKYPNESALAIKIKETTTPDIIYIENGMLPMVTRFPIGVMEMRSDMPDVVKTSNNLGVMTLKEGRLKLTFHTRSFDNKEMKKVAQDISRTLMLYGFTHNTLMDTPSWNQTADTPFIQLVDRTFCDILGFSPRKVAMHFVLEAGYYVEKYPGIEIACIGPRINEPHSTKERVELSTIDDIYAVLTELLRRLGNGEEKPKITQKNCIGMNIDAQLFDYINNGYVTKIDIEIDDDIYKDILENIDGNLVLCTDEMPEYFYGCYIWNKGEFPYIIKDSLKYLLLINGSRRLPVEITGYDTSVASRFGFDTTTNKYIEDPDGECCYWRVTFNIKVAEADQMPESSATYEKRRTYLMRWNPGISSFKLKDYKQATTECPEGFMLDWSIYDWEDAQEGDIYYMVRVGDDNAGIVFRGEFQSAPYTGGDWAGKGKQRYYVDMSCEDCAPADGKPWLTVAELQEAIPEIEWGRGHSGELITEEVTLKLEELWNKATKI